MYSFAELFVGLLFLFLFRAKFHCKFDVLWATSRNILIQAMLFSAPLILLGMFDWVRNMSARWVIAWMLDTASVGIYIFYFSLSYYSAAALQGFVSLLILPALYRLSTNNETDQFNELHRNGVALTIMAAFCILLVVFGFHTELIILLGDERYSQYSIWLPVMMISSFAVTLALMTTYEAFADMKTMVVFWPNIIAGLFSIVSSVFFINLYGLKGAMISFLVTNGGYASLLYLASRRYRRGKAEGSHSQDVIR